MSFSPYAIFTVNPLHLEQCAKRDVRAFCPREGPGTHGNIFLVLVISFPFLDNPSLQPYWDEDTNIRYLEEPIFLPSVTAAKTWTPPGTNASAAHGNDHRSLTIIRQTERQVSGLSVTGHIWSHCVEKKKPTQPLLFIHTGSASELLNPRSTASSGSSKNKPIHRLICVANNPGPQGKDQSL